MAEIFSPADREELEAEYEVVWGRDGPLPADDFAAALGEVDAVVFGTWHYPGEAIAAAGSRLRAVIEVAGGHSHADLDYGACFARGIAVAGVAPAFGPAVAEMALGLALASNRRIVDSDRGFRSGTERYLHEGDRGARLLYGRRVGLVGCGGLARSLLPLLAPFDVTVVGFDPWIDDAELRRGGIEPADLETLFAGSDVVFVLAVPTAENRGLVDERLLGLLSPDAVLVLVSRAHLVDFAALTRFVLAGRFRAAIDVYPQEPLPPDHPIRRADGAVLTAHLAGAVPEALRGIGRMVLDDLPRLLGGLAPQRLQSATPAMIRGLRSTGPESAPAG
jgi:phosphoglycerate dehydrogenase-like enzyme